MQGCGATTFFRILFCLQSINASSKKVKIGKSVKLGRKFARDLISKYFYNTELILITSSIWVTGIHKWI